MSRQLTVEDARESLNIHIEAKGLEIYAQYGPRLGWKELLQLLTNRKLVRYPCEVVFDAGPLEAGEFAQVAPKGERPEDGFTIFVHPFFMTQLNRVPCLVLYQLVLVNYGDFASSDDAESFGAAALGILREEYYQMICELADQVS
jgi:hypothetical protein